MLVVDLGEALTAFPVKETVTYSVPGKLPLVIYRIDSSGDDLHIANPRVSGTTIAFDVILYASRPGVIDRTVIVYLTSGETLTVNIFCKVSPNPFGIVPTAVHTTVIGHRTITPITIYNPHNTTLMVRQIFTENKDVRVHFDPRQTGPWSVAPLSRVTVATVEHLVRDDGQHEVGQKRTCLL